LIGKGERKGRFDLAVGDDAGQRFLGLLNFGLNHNLLRRWAEM
jgi:hypothetical protein